MKESLKKNSFKDIDLKHEKILKKYNKNLNEFKEEFAHRLIFHYVKGQVFHQTIEASAAIAKVSLSPKLVGLAAVLSQEADHAIEIVNQVLNLDSKYTKYAKVSFAHVDNNDYVYLKLTVYDQINKKLNNYALIVNPHVVLD